MKSSLLSVENLKVHYPLKTSFWNRKKSVYLKAVDGVSFDLEAGKVLGLVGESGCGKSSLGKAIMRLTPHVQGKIQLDGTSFLSLKGKALREFRTRIQMVFQDPYASLDPRLTIFETLSEPLDAHFNLTKKEKLLKIEEVMEWVNLNLHALKKYPHEFSGGQRQRVAIARALILNPKVIVADEPVSSLDVSVQAQILNLIKKIQKELNLTLIFISHNLAVVRYISDEIAVMYLGKIVEKAPQEILFKNPRHPYTKVLLDSVPIPDPRLERERKHVALSGELPSPVRPPSGCTFHNRCPIALPDCKARPPELIEKSDAQWVRCPVVE